ncbi:aromatic prenyl transferase [Drechmeria coniospora]|uniref:Aromatic prenyl transferase n=1 Tax=Drechmeria coniospora TaxID=98403 RepID=A0A151GTW8_DRECN|nr:aromatic prenyl transferase [Drechmeria coniospora]KYK60559.1 aromatic prenyl transferase [Drechmeria coniospora]
MTGQPAITEMKGHSSAADLEYWTAHAVPVLRSLLRSTGSYSSEEQDAQVQFLTKHVLPNLGPRPSVAYTKSFLTKSGSPIQLSVNLSARKPLVRYCWEILGPQGGSESDPFAIEAAKNIISHFADTLGFSTQWSDVLMKSFALTPEEQAGGLLAMERWMAKCIPADAPVKPPKSLPLAFAAFDLKGDQVSSKTYFNPKVKEIVTGASVNELTWAVLRDLKPALHPEAIDLVQEFLSTRPVPSGIELVGVDCVDEAGLANARVKLYVHSKSNSFNTVREYVTIGGRLKDEATRKSLEVLHEIWPLLLQEPEGLPDDDFDKPLKDASMFFQKLYFSFELRPGCEHPEVKTYLPTWNYVRSDEETVQNYSAVFRKCGYEWGQEGKYKAVFEDAFGPVNQERAVPVHCDASFLFSEKNGIYQTVYFSTPLAEEAGSEVW